MSKAKQYIAELAFNDELKKLKLLYNLEMFETIITSELDKTKVEKIEPTIFHKGYEIIKYEGKYTYLKLLSDESEIESFEILHFEEVADADYKIIAQRERARKFSFIDFSIILASIVGIIMIVALSVTFIDYIKTGGSLASFVYIVAGEFNALLVSILVMMYGFKQKKQLL